MENEDCTVHNTWTVRLAVYDNGNLKKNVIVQYLCSCERSFHKKHRFTYDAIVAVVITFSIFVFF